MREKEPTFTDLFLEKNTRISKEINKIGLCMLKAVEVRDDPGRHGRQPLSVFLLQSAT